MRQPDADNLLAQEYLLLQKRIEEFDTRLLTIKAWSVTFAAGAIGLAWQLGSPLLLLVSAISALAFWIVETITKSHQRAHYPRLKAIEGHFAGGPKVSPMQISTSWYSVWYSEGRQRRFLRHATYANVCFPHIIIIATALGLLLFSPPVKEDAHSPRLSVVVD